MQLQEIDKAFTDVPGFRPVAQLVIEQSGIDPVGMRQLNLDLMDAAAPGINNVVVHIRPYAFMAWAWRKATEMATEGDVFDPERAKDTVLRYEAMYAWAHSLAGHPFRGAAAIRRHLPLKGSDAVFRFEGAEWDELKRDMTSLMAPTEYGPSIKATRWLLPVEGGAFRNSTEAEPAVEAIEAIASAHVPQWLLGRDPPTATCEDVRPFAERLAADQPTDAERSAFRLLFHGLGRQPDAQRELRRRMATIDLLRALLAEAGGPLGLADIRRRLATGSLPAGLEGDMDELATSAAVLCMLQARQLQRLAAEAVMLWIDANLSDGTDRPRSGADLANQADAESKAVDPLAAAAETVGGYMDAIEGLGADTGWPAAASVGDTDIVTLMDRLHSAQGGNQERVPGACLRAFAVVRAVSRAMQRHALTKSAARFLSARPDRMPFTLLEEQIEAVADRPLASFWRLVIEDWVIGQHVHWSAVRGGDGKLRLRFGLEGPGWIRVRGAMSGRFLPTDDRLLTLLSLGSECGLFARTGVAKDSLFAAA